MLSQILVDTQQCHDYDMPDKSIHSFNEHIL